MGLSSVSEGPDPDRYLVAVDDSIERSVEGPEGEALFEDLDPGEHTVGVKVLGIGPVCLPARYIKRTGFVEAGEITDLRFSISIRCVRREFMMEIDPDVDIEDETISRIEDGFTIGQLFFADSVGGDLDLQEQRKMRVDVTKSGEGPFAGVTESGDSIRIVFDVKGNWGGAGADQPWSREVDEEETVVHEYGHAFFRHVGCSDGTLPRWFNEGSANYMSHRAMIARGAMDEEEVREFQLSAAWSTGELDYPLSELEGTKPDRPWPGHIGQLAVGMLLKNHSGDGVLSLRHVCEEIAVRRTEGVSSSEAFSDALREVFGISKVEFYDEFESWRRSIS